MVFAHCFCVCVASTKSCAVGKRCAICCWVRSCDEGFGGEVLTVYSNTKILGTDSTTDNKGAFWQTPLLKQAGLPLLFAVKVLHLRSFK